MMRGSFCLGIAPVLLSVGALVAQPIGTTLDINADGTVDHTYMGNSVWEPPLTSQPPVGTLVTMGDSGKTGTLIDQDGNGAIDTLLLSDGTLIDIPNNGGGGGGGGGSSDGGPPTGTKLYFPDGTPHTCIGNNQWSPAFSQMPPAGSYGSFPNGQEFILLDSNGDGNADCVDIGKNGSCDVEINGGGGGGQAGPSPGTKLDFEADGVWDIEYIGEQNGQDVWSGRFPEGGPPDGTLVGSPSGEVQGCLRDTNGDGTTDAYDEGCNGEPYMPIGR